MQVVKNDEVCASWAASETGRGFQHPDRYTSGHIHTQQVRAICTIAIANLRRPDAICLDWQAGNDGCHLR